MKLLKRLLFRRACVDSSTQPSSLSSAVALPNGKSSDETATLAKADSNQSKSIKSTEPNSLNVKRTKSKHDAKYVRRFWLQLKLTFALSL